MAVYCITGGTGSLGTALVHHLLAQGHKVRTISRNEHKIEDLRASIPAEYAESLSAMVGDVRDEKRVKKALRGVQYVVHAAALKGVPICEYDPEEAIKTNVDGSAVVANASLENGVERAVLVSTDKACQPVTLYGYSKALAERTWLAFNRYSAGQGTTFMAVRYGNVFNSAGSVWRVWKGCNGAAIPVTDRGSTRFHITLPQAVRFVLRALGEAHRDELWIPKLPVYNLGNIADAWGSEQKVIGLRNGEKLHESMVSKDESCCTVEDGDHWVMTPGHVKTRGGWEYTSGGSNVRVDGQQMIPGGRWLLKRDEMAELVREAKGN